VNHWLAANSSCSSADARKFGQIATRQHISWLDVNRFCRKFFVVVELESANLFKTLPPVEWRELNKIAEERRSAVGSEIFREGDPGDGIYVVKEGLVEISALVAENQRRVLSQRGPGEIFGEMAVVEDRPRSATATAVKDTRLYFLPRSEMLAMLQHSPGLSFNILQEVSHRLREFDQLHLREVVQAERLAVLGNFARSIIHDLKTPLTIIGLSSEIACMPNATPEKRALAQERIRKQIWRINDMVGDILEFTRSRQPDAQLATVNYSDFIAEIFPELRAEAETKSAQLEMENQPPPVKVILDARRLHRVFFNLIHNATDVMPDNGKIFLRFRVDKNEVITEVEDTGPGIASQIVDKLFQPFATHGKSHGTGLGLSICKKTIEDHDGKIWLRNEPGRGAIFCFSIPIAK
jgi:signal transduction histidine kinase